MAARTNGAAGLALAISTFAKTVSCITVRSSEDIPAVSLFEYTREQMRHEFSAPKSCAPYCTVSCVQQVAMIDNWRAPQKPVSKSSSLPIVPHSALK